VLCDERDWRVLGRPAAAGKHCRPVALSRDGSEPLYATSDQHAGQNRRNILAVGAERERAHTEGGLARAGVTADRCYVCATVTGRALREQSRRGGLATAKSARRRRRRRRRSVVSRGGAGITESIPAAADCSVSRGGLSSQSISRGRLRRASGGQGAGGGRCSGPGLLRLPRWPLLPEVSGPQKALRWPRASLPERAGAGDRRARGCAASLIHRVAHGALCGAAYRPSPIAPRAASLRERGRRAGGRRQPLAGRGAAWHGARQRVPPRVWHQQAGRRRCDLRWRTCT
jgi:hypothetical protein